MAFSFQYNKKIPLGMAVSVLGLLSLIAARLLSHGITASEFQLIFIFGIIAAILRGLQLRFTISQRSIAGLGITIPAMFLYGPGQVLWVVIISLVFADVIIGHRRFQEEAKFRQTTYFSLCTLPVSAAAGSILFQLMGGSLSQFGFEYIFPALAGLALYLVLITALSGAINALVWKPADPDNLADAPTFANDSLTLLSMGILGLINTFVISQDLYWGLTLATSMTFLTSQYTRIASYSKQLYLGIINALMVLIEFRDPYTKGHSDRVATYSVHIAGAMGLAERETDNIYHAALLHDLGKTGISQKILHKPGPLTKREYARIKEHVEISSRIIGQIDYSGKIHQLVRSHHERIDGRGYPDQLKGTEIPLGARIIAIADAFDAMTTLRPYRSSFSVSQALEEVQDSAGTQLDADIVRIALPVLARVSATFNLSNTTDDFPLRGASSPLRHSFWEGDTSLAGKIDRSEFLDQLTICGVAQYCAGVLTNLPRECMINQTGAAALADLAAKSLKTQKKHDDVFVTEQKKVYHCTAIPQGESANLVILDCTKVLNVEEIHMEQIESAYSESLRLITGGKFILIGEEELPKYLGGRYVSQIALESAEDLPEVLQTINQLFHGFAFEHQRIEELLLCINEAIINVFKHGTKGQLSIVSLADRVRVIVADNGLGLDVKTLPNILFRLEGPGKVKRGLALMIKCLDSVALCTGVNGTTLIFDERVTS